jgi:tetratricopeptide (TPR) repeat protein
MAGKKLTVILCCCLTLALCSCAGQNATFEQEVEQTDRSCSYFYFLWGNQAEFNGDFEEALQAYEKALICDPSAAYVKEKLPTLLIKMGKFEEAAPWLYAAIAEQPENINYKLILANLLLQEDKTGEAIDLYHEILQLDPANESVSLQLGILYIHLKEFEKAEELLAELVRVNSYAYYPNLFLARVRKQLGETGKAAKGYEKALAINWSSDVAYELGHLYVNQKMYEDALRIFTTITDNDQEDERAALSRIQTLLDLELNDEALQGLRNTRLFTKDPDKIDLVISKVLLRQKQIAEARAILERLTRKSELSEPIYMLGLLDFQEENYQSSLNYLKRIGPESEEFEGAVYLLTRLYQRINEPDKAITLLREYTSNKETRSPLFYALLSSFYQEKDEISAAFGVMQEATDLYPENYQLFFEYGLLLERNGRQDEAVARMQRVLEIEPEHADALNFIGYVWADRNINLQQALGYILKAVELKPEDGYIIDSLGWVYYRLKDFTKAIHWLSRALELKPADPNIFDHLGDAYRAAGQDEKAMKAYESAFDLYEDKEKRDMVEKKINALQIK